ncbi:type I restriction enzyme, S subunit [Yersinia aldovae ATCC 35236]|uniref:Type I restriction enzyme, S subunit n=1 Tax=Yersinia aldovae TaxID=29483 RepID=A0A0T9TWB9_YERAL|nr:restriction endonuclease subunit S [Yersinia aldovae]EEP93990.1 type I restriction enzyme, S subunit [Yersinia aldovae ATCC 35236]CNL05691.1 type I restriction enzyme%2C S subunit [Yersinia aldovae]
MSMDSKVPEIRFKGFGGEWVENNLGELIDIRSAARVHKEQWTEAGVPFFRTSDVVSIYKGQENTKAYISHEVYNDLSEKIGKVTKDDLLITGGGSIGIPYLVPNDDPLYFKDADLLWLKNNKKFNGYFLYTFFFSAPFKKHIKGISHTGTIAHYTIEQAKATPINTCYDEEQTQIGNYFQKLDALINQHQQKHDKLRNIKKSMLEKMFPKQGETIPEIRFKGFNGEWEEAKLGEIGDTFTGLSGKTKDDFGHGQGRFVTYLNVFSNAISNENSVEPIEIDTNQNEVKKGDVFFTTSSETPEEVGMSSIWMSEIKNVYLNSFCFGYRPKQQFDSYYLAYMLRSNSFREKIVFLAQGISRYNISKTKVMDIKVSIPCLSEQEKVGNYFQKLDALINQHQQQITKLNNIKQACLSKMFI